MECNFVLFDKEKKSSPCCCHFSFFLFVRQIAENEFANTISLIAQVTTTESWITSNIRWSGKSKLHRNWDNYQRYLRDIFWEMSFHFGRREKLCISFLIVCRSLLDLWGRENDEVEKINSGKQLRDVSLIWRWKYKLETS